MSLHFVLKSMDLQLVATLCLLFTSISASILAMYAACNFRTPGAKSYVGLMISVMLYSFGYALEINHSTVEGILYSLRIEYLGIAFLPACWVILSIRYSGYGDILTKRWYIALFAIPMITLLVMNTNSLHHLHYKALSINDTGPFPIAELTKGIWYHIHSWYTNICFLAGNLIFFLMMLRSAGQTRQQAATMFYGSLFPWAFYLLYLCGVTPYHIDVVPFSLAIVGPLFGVALFRFKMFDFPPIARHTVFDYMHDPVLVLDVTNRLADFNRAAAFVFPNLSRNIIGTNIHKILSEHPNLFEDVDSSHVVSKEISIGRGKAKLTFERSIIPINKKAKRPKGKVLILHDITQQKHLMATFQKQARQDVLTGLYNRRYFMEESKKMFRYMVRYGHAFSLIIIDLDHFKSINDQYGHLAGDEVLRHTANLFKGMLRSADIIGRYGGEEFILFLPETTPDVGRIIADRLRIALSNKKFDVDGQHLHLTASFGVTGSLNPVENSNLMEICKKADEALYFAKRKGRDRVDVLL